MKKVATSLIILLYILVIFDMIINSEKYFFKDNYLFIINIFLLCIGFYNLINNLNKENKK